MTDVLTFPKAMLSIFPYRAKDIWLEGLIKDRFKDLSQRGKVAVGTSGALRRGAHTQVAFTLSNLGYASSWSITYKTSCPG